MTERTLESTISIEVESEKRALPPLSTETDEDDPREMEEVETRCKLPPSNNSYIRVSKVSRSIRSQVNTTSIRDMEA